MRLWERLTRLAAATVESCGMDVELGTVRRHLQLRLPLGLLFGHLGGISLFLLGAKEFL